MNEQYGHDIEDLHVGMTASFAKTITEADIVLFAGVSGDNNAVHTNEEFAATTPFGGRIAHGFLTASVISAAVANRLPGPGTVYLGQQLRFLAPVRPGDTVHATVTVKSVNLEKARAVLATVCTVRGAVVIDGEGHVYVADTENDRIQEFTSTGTFVTAWGTTGSAAGQLRSPMGVTTDGADRVYVADDGNYRIELFGPAPVPDLPPAAQKP